MLNVQQIQRRRYVGFVLRLMRKEKLSECLLKLKGFWKHSVELGKLSLTSELRL